MSLDLLFTSVGEDFPHANVTFDIIGKGYRSPIYNSVTAQPYAKASKIAGTKTRPKDRAKMGPEFGQSEFLVYATPSVEVEPNDLLAITETLYRVIFVDTLNEDYIKMGVRRV